MKLKEGFLLREVAGQYLVISTASDLNMNKMITLNETGAFLWKLMEEEVSEAVLTAALLTEYDVDEATAQRAVTSFAAKLREHGFLA